MTTPTGLCLFGHYCKRKVDTQAPIGTITTVSGVRTCVALETIHTYNPYEGGDYLRFLRSCRLEAFIQRGAEIISSELLFFICFLRPSRWSREETSVPKGHFAPAAQSPLFHAPLALIMIWTGKRRALVAQRGITARPVQRPTIPLLVLRGKWPGCNLLPLIFPVVLCYQTEVYVEPQYSPFVLDGAFILESSCATYFPSQGKLITPLPTRSKHASENAKTPPRLEQFELTGHVVEPMHACESIRYFCPEGTQSATEHPCPPGTYASGTLTSSEDDCVEAEPGWYALGSANTAPTGRCELLLPMRHT